MKRRRVVSLTQALTGQDLQAIIEDLCAIVREWYSDSRHAPRAISAACISAIEQLCRHLIALRLSMDDSTMPQTLTIDIVSLHRAADMPPAVLVSFAYNFQSVAVIIEVLRGHGIADPFRGDEGLKRDYGALVAFRHDRIHTSTYKNLDGRAAYETTERLAFRLPRDYPDMVIDMCLLEGDIFRRMRPWRLSKRGCEKAPELCAAQVASTLQCTGAHNVCGARVRRAGQAASAEAGSRDRRARGRGRGVPAVRFELDIAGARSLQRTCMTGSAGSRGRSRACAAGSTTSSCTTGAASAAAQGRIRRIDPAAAQGPFRVAAQEGPDACSGRIAQLKTAPDTLQPPNEIPMPCSGDRRARPHAAALSCRSAARGRPPARRSHAALWDSPKHASNLSKKLLRRAGTGDETRDRATAPCRALARRWCRCRASPCLARSRSRLSSRAHQSRSPRQTPSASIPRRRGCPAGRAATWDKTARRRPCQAPARSQPLGHQSRAGRAKGARADGKCRQAGGGEPRHRRQRHVCLFGAPRLGRGHVLGQDGR